MNTGKNWKFSKEKVGDWIIKYKKNFSNFLISDAVAASTAVPGLFRPLLIKVPDYRGKIALCDGGIYDNQGLHSLTSSTNLKEPYDAFIVSDGSAPFEIKLDTKISIKWYKVLLRQSNIMMSRIKNLQFQNLLFKEYKLTPSAYFSIDWNPSKILESIKGKKEYLAKANIPDNVDLKTYLLNNRNLYEIKEAISDKQLEQISQIKTHLSSLSKAEINLLSKHGELLSGTQIKLYLNKYLN